MPLVGRHPVWPYPLYLILECGMSFLLGISYATITVYWVISGRLNPLELLLLDIALELSYFMLQLPIPLSRLIAVAADREMRLRIGRAVVAEWEAEHGAFTPEELATARAEMAAADNEYFRRSEGGAA